MTRATLMIILAPACVMALRSAVQRDNLDEVTFLATEEGEEVKTTNVDSGTVFELDAQTQTVMSENEKYEDSEITHLVEIRTKLKFIGNKVQWRNPGMVETLVNDIKGQQDAHPGSKFLFCLHVGTTAEERIKSQRPGFIEGRSQTFLNALNQHAQTIGVFTSSVGPTVYEHFESSRFAGLVMKVYKGATDPRCAKDDLIPPPASGAESRTSPQPSQMVQEQPDEVTYLPMEGGEDVATLAVDSGTIFELDSTTQTVMSENEKYENSEITHLLEIRTKLKFVGNHVELRNPDMVQTLVNDIKEQQDSHPGSKFLFCLHVGTTAQERIKKSRPGFVEGRSQSFLDSLDSFSGALGVGSTSTLAPDVYEHFESSRFAGMVMKVYTGPTDPVCAQDDLVPPPA
jgi:uncharacterized protein YjaG (DUF416 family)